jgi:hypothetical protein
VQAAARTIRQAVTEHLSDLCQRIEAGEELRDRDTDEMLQVIHDACQDYFPEQDTDEEDQSESEE